MEGRGKINLGQDREEWRASLNRTIKHAGCINFGDFLASCATVSFSESLCCMGLVSYGGLSPSAVRKFLF